MYENMTLYDAFKFTASKSPHAVAVYYQGYKFTYAKLDKQISSMADAIYHRLGIRKGDVVVVAQPNIPHVLILYYALNKIGAVINFIHPFTPYNQVLEIMKKTNSKMAFLFEQRVAKEVEKYRSIADKIYLTRVEDFLPLGKRFIYHNFLNNKIRKKLGRWRGQFFGFNYVYQLKPTGKPFPINTQNDKELSILLHSGSTTGEPKTICLSDSRLNFIADRFNEILGCKKEDIKKFSMLTVLPSFHGFGLCMTMHGPLVTQMRVVLMPKFSVKETVHLMNKNKISFICGVPTMYENLLKYPDFINSKKLKNLHSCYCGGDAMPEKLKIDFDNLMIKNNYFARLYEGYGLTECVAVNIVNGVKASKIGALGKPVNGAEVKIIDENGHSLPINEVGEIVLKSPSIMIGYYKDEKATKNALIDGWLHTGDLGYIDEEGFVFFKSRKKRVVKVSGVGVFPTEIEKLVSSIHGVKSCCAIQIPDERLQHAIKIFVVADYFDEEGMRESIMEKCQKYLIRWAVPKEIEFRKELPLTKLNKVDFMALQKEENAKRDINNA